MKTLKRILFVSVLAFSLSSCEKYLDLKPNRSLAIPSSLQDLRALLDDETGSNSNYPDAGDIASDYYYLDDADWAARTEVIRETYIWHPESQRNHWYSNYSRINYMNVVLDAVNKIKVNENSKEERGHIKGTAHFFRGFTFLALANLYSPVYEAGKNQSKLGIPLRLVPDVNITSTRSSLEETFDQIIQDLKAAAFLLPKTSIYHTRPTKPVAYAALARTYLIAGNYKQAILYADSCLSLRSELIDYNDLDLKAKIPFEIFNVESLLFALMDGSSSVFNQARAKVNPAIYDLYEENDLRKQVFFLENKDGSYAFKGSYAGRAPTSAFAGIGVDEVYLIRAESAARLENTAQALDDLNTLLIKRYLEGKFKPIDISDKEKLLRYILEERKKELVFRGGISWSDLRRLNLDPRFARDLVRNVQGKEYRLSANDLRYTFLIPTVVMQKTIIEQNSR